MKRLEYESDIENYLFDRVADAGGLCIKIGYDGLPDRLVLLPGGRVRFVELKRHDGQTSPLQDYRASVLRRLGFKVSIPKSKHDCDTLLAELADEPKKIS